MYTTKHSDLVLLNSHPFILSCFSFQNFKLDDVLFCQGPHLPHERLSYGLGPHSVCASALWGQGHSFLRWLLPTFSSEPGYTALSSSSCSEICHQANRLTWGVLPGFRHTWSRGDLTKATTAKLCRLWLKRQESIFSQFWRLEFGTQVPIGPGSSEDLSSWFVDGCAPFMVFPVCFS